MGSPERDPVGPNHPDRLSPDGRTPIDRLSIDDVWVKRDDLFEVAGVQGGKVRTCLAIASEPGICHGLVTAGARHSPQVHIVGAIGRFLGVPVRAHVPQGEATPELVEAEALGVTLIRHKAGHNSVIVARAREDAEKSGWRLIPFGMEHPAAVEQTASQVPAILPVGIQRIVVPVGSGMSLAGIFTGMMRQTWRKPIVGIVVGADPKSRLDRFAPMWRLSGLVKLMGAGVPYHHLIQESIGNIPLDPVYEAKCVHFLRPGDLLWIVGKRTAKGPVEYTVGSGVQTRALPRFDAGGSRAKWGT